MNLEKPLNRYIDHTLLKADATAADIEKLCRQAVEYDFFAVCVNPCWVSLAADLVAGSNSLVACVCGFPLGATSSDVKVLEAMRAAQEGASEIDMVINIGWLKDGNYEAFKGEIEDVIEAVPNAVVKVIIETCLLTDQEKIKACQLALEAGAKWVKTSTGFAGGGAKASDVALMRKIVDTRGYIKASGGIRDYDTALSMIEAGADRIGASASLKIVTETEEK